MSTPPQGSDGSNTQPPQSGQDLVAQRLARGAATIQALQGSDLNQQAPIAQYDPVSKLRYFTTAPTPVKRLMGSPLAKSGQFAQGPNQERLVVRGWGDPGANTVSNNGLDYAAVLNETVFAAADGTVTFVGFQAKGTSVQQVEVNGISSNASAQTLIDANGNVVASVSQGNIGYNGIYIVIEHNGDFAGYQTVYTHLSSATGCPPIGKPVSEGQAIGKVGVTGGPYGFLNTSPFTHFQINFVSAGFVAPVNPSALVPNYWPGHPDSTTSALGTPLAAIALIPAAAGVQVMSSLGLANTQALDRATLLENQTIAQIKSNHASYADLLAGRLQVDQNALHAAVNTFRSGGTIVQSPMTFDFQNGVWTDGSPL